MIRRLFALAFLLIAYSIGGASYVAAGPPSTSAVVAVATHIPTFHTEDAAQTHYPKALPPGRANL